MDKRDEVFDNFLGINTKEYSEEFDLELRKRMLARYEPTPYEALTQLFKLVQITSNDTVVDFGCGRGRFIFFCNQKYGCRVKGIENNQEIFKDLVVNSEYYKSRFFVKSEKILTYNIEAIEYDVLEEDSIFFFFNPFSPEMFMKIIDKILYSKIKENREITVILYYPWIEYLDALKVRNFRLIGLVKIPNRYEEDINEKIYVFVN